MTIERDHSRHISSADQSSAHDKASRDQTSRENSADHRYASVEDSMALLETIMDERSEVFRKLAQ